MQMPRFRNLLRRARYAATIVVLLGAGLQVHAAAPPAGVEPAAATMRAPGLDFCPIHPLGVPRLLLQDAEPGSSYMSIPVGDADAIAWLTWTGDPSAQALAASLVPPGDSDRYRNPDDPTDQRLDPGDWAKRVPGRVHSATVRNALDALVGHDIVVPVLGEARGQGAHPEGQVERFVLVRLNAVDLRSGLRISFDYIQDHRCYNVPPVASPSEASTPEDTVQEIVLQATDANDDALAFEVLSGPVHGQLSGAAPALLYMPAPDYHGDDAITFVASDGEFVSEPATVSITVVPVNDPPVAVALAVDTEQGRAVDVLLSATDVDSSALSYRIVQPPARGTLSGTAPALRYLPQAGAIGSDSFTYVAHDGEIDSAPATVTIQIAPSAYPCLAPAQDADGDGLLDPSCVDAFVPPDPASIAPPNDPTVPTVFFTSFRFLADATTPVQRGLAPGTVAADSAAVLRGRVLDEVGQPLAGVLVRTLDHPELGYTWSRADGYYDLLVNGGATLTLDFQRDGYLRAQRQARQVPWQDFALLDDVALVPLDPNVTTIAFGADAPPQHLQGSWVSDADGMRQGTLFIPAGTNASLELHDGTRVPMGSLDLRITEYTVGEHGPARMPAPLPSSSGYTYAVEIGADEAIAANARSVVFSRAAAYYVHDFLGFPVGSIVPVGWYDYDNSAWRPSANGRVVQVLGQQNGQALLDVTGSGQPSTAAELAALGIDAAELHMLASTYSAGDTLWRSPITHLTPWDCNWPVAPPDDAEPPDIDSFKSPRTDDEPEEECGSIIGCQNLSVGETIAAAGAPFRLRYQSDRAGGHAASRSARLRFGASTPPASLLKVAITWRIAGAEETRELSAITPGALQEFRWDGNDVFGRPVFGALPVVVTVDYVFNGHLAQPAELDAAFARWSTTTMRLVRRGTTAVAFSEVRKDVLSRSGATGRIGEGWGLDVQHSYHAQTGWLARGDGSRVAGSSLSPVVWHETLGLDNPLAPLLGDGDKLSQGRFYRIFDIERFPDDALLISDERYLWRVEPDGTVRHFAGGSYDSQCTTRPCAPIRTDARQVWLAMADTVIDKRGCVFALSAYPQTELLRICNGMAESLWAPPHSYSPGRLALTDDGRLFIYSRSSNSIYQIDPYADATPALYSSRNVVAGQLYPGSNWGQQWYYGSDNGGPAAAATLHEVVSMAVAPDGSLQIGERSGVIRRIDAGGIIHRVAGRPAPQCDDYGAPACTGVFGLGFSALAATIDVHHGFTGFLPDGTYLFAGIRAGQHGPASGLLAIDAAGTLIALGPWDPAVNEAECAGATSNCHSGIPITQFPGSAAGAGVVMPNGHWLVADGGVLQRFGPALPTLSVTEHLIGDRGQLHRFDAAGRHRETRDATTGRTLLRFEYDGNRLVAVIDADGQRTVIERAGEGVPRAIVAPHGQRTELEYDIAGDLRVVRDPLGHEHRMDYQPGGLLTRFQRPGAAPSTFTYDALGYLETDVNPLGGGWSLQRSERADGWRVTLTSAEGRSQRYDTRHTANGERIRITQARDGGVASRVEHPDALTEWQAADGSQGTLQAQPDPRFGLSLPVHDATVSLPSGLTQVVERSRRATLADSSDPLSLLTQTDTQVTNGRTSTRTFDRTARQYTWRSPMGRETRLWLDAQQRPSRLERSGLAPVHYGYDNFGRLQQLTLGEGTDARTTTFGFDTFGYLDSVEDPLGRLTVLDNDVLGRTTRQLLPDLRQIGFAHDARGNLTALTPPGRDAHGFVHDDLDQLGAYLPPLTSEVPAPETRYAYNLDRQLERVTRPDGAIIDPHYDPVTGRLTALATPEGETRVGPLPGGRTGWSESPDGVRLDYGWDGPLLANVSWSGAVQGTVSYTRDANFWLTGLTVGSTTTTFGHDDDGLLTSTTVAGQTLTLARDPGNGLLTGSTLGSLNDSWVHNAFAEPTDYQARLGSTPLLGFGYGRDALGRITTLAERDGVEADITTAYGYDTAGRLETVQRDGVPASAYVFDANGNRREHRIGMASLLRGRSWACLGDLTGTAEVLVLGSYDAQDRMTSYGTCSYTYTANGELSARTDTATGATTSYRYDVLGNLQEATLADGSHIAYTIDGQNRRVGKAIDGVPVQGFLYGNQLEPVAELDGSGQVVATFVYAERPHVPSLMLKGGKLYRIVADHLGSVGRVVDTATGAIAQRMAYDEYGNVVADSNPGFQPFGFAGGIHDRDTGLTRFGARDYDPISGRWTAKDPIRFAGGDANLYAYVGGNPISFIDPTGLLSTDAQKLVCDYMGTANGDVAEAWARSLQDRKADIPGGSWNSHDLRLAENYLYAHAAVSSYGDNPDVAAIGVDVHATLKLFLEPLGYATSPYSRSAHMAGQEGNLDARHGRAADCGCSK